MKHLRIVLLLVGLAMVLSWGAGTAGAAGPYLGGHAQAGVPFYYPFYAQYGREHIPYFSLHPPVYYSYPVPRTYGYSPFAYPFGSPTPDLEFPGSPPVEQKPEPKVMHNPYVQEASHKERTTKAEPKMIYNPFVRSVSHQQEAGQKEGKTIVNPYVAAKNEF